MDCSHPRALIEPIITLGDLVTEDGQVNNSFLENLRDQQVFGIRGRSVLREEEEDSTNATTSEEREVESVSVTTPTTSSSLVIIQTATNNNVIAVRNRSSRNRRNYLQYLHPVIFPPLISNRVIPLPEFPPERNGRSNTSTVVPSEEEDSLASSSFRLGEAIAFSHADLNCELSRDNNNAMVALTNLWNCECPVPGSKPLVVCKDCRRRERKWMDYFKESLVLYFHFPYYSILHNNTSHEKLNGLSESFALVNCNDIMLSMNLFLGQCDIR